MVKRKVQWKTKFLLSVYSLSCCSKSRNKHTQSLRIVFGRQWGKLNETKVENKDTESIDVKEEQSKKKKVIFLYFSNTQLRFKNIILLDNYSCDSFCQWLRLKRGLFHNPATNLLLGYKPTTAFPPSSLSNACSHSQKKKSFRDKPETVYFSFIQVNLHWLYKADQ